jgi:hypothetical protein
LYRYKEGIISRLEGLLEQAVVDGRRLAEAEAEAGLSTPGCQIFYTDHTLAVIN